MTAPVFRDYEVEVTLMVTAPNYSEACAAVERSGVTPGVLIGEALVEHIYVWKQHDEVPA